MSRSFNSNLPEVPDASLEPGSEVADSIQLFRTAMNSIAERETARPVATDWLIPARRRQRVAQRRMILAWSCAAALCVAAVPLSTHAPHATGNKVVAQAPQPAPTDTQDTALLEQVDNEIASPVPSSLAPLTELDSWNSTSSTTESSINSTEKKNVTQ